MFVFSTGKPKKAPFWGLGAVNLRCRSQESPIGLLGRGIYGAHDRADAEFYAQMKGPSDLWAHHEHHLPEGSQPGRPIHGGLVFSRL